MKTITCNSYFLILISLSVSVHVVFVLHSILDSVYSSFIHFSTSHDYVHIADVECPILFAIVTVQCFMCNIALVTF